MKNDEVEDQIEQATGTSVTERWIRLPRTRRHCEWTGFTRAYFYELIKGGHIKSRCLRRPGCATGVRLVWLPSVMNYIERVGEDTSSPLKSDEPSGETGP